jgi:uncharacterized damage-inducible protein DinB
MDVDLLTWYRYTIWANEQVINGARQLSAEQLNTPIRPGFLSTLGLLVHIMDAERIWLSRWKGIFPRALMSPADLPTLDALIADWTPRRAEMLEFLAGVGEARQDIHYVSTKGEAFHNILWHLIVHVLNHGTEHRAQVALYLAMHGIDVGNLDLVQYLREGARNAGEGQ